MQPTTIFGIIILFWFAFVGIGCWQSVAQQSALEAYSAKCTAAGGNVFKGYVGSHNAVGCFKADKIEIKL